jgi:hypothetical protein
VLAERARRWAARRVRLLSSRDGDWLSRGSCCSRLVVGDGEQNVDDPTTSRVIEEEPDHICWNAIAE